MPARAQGAERRALQWGGDGEGAGLGLSAVEQLQALLLGEGAEPSSAEPGAIRVGERRRQLALPLPSPPGDRDRGQAFRAATLGERVEERVGGGVVALSGAAEAGGRRGVEDEGAEVEIRR